MRVAIVTLVLCLALAGCGTHGSAQGGASEGGAGGHLKVGLPF